MPRRRMLEELIRRRREELRRKINNPEASFMKRERKIRHRLATKS